MGNLGIKLRSASKHRATMIPGPLQLRCQQNHLGKCLKRTSLTLEEKLCPRGGPRHQTQKIPASKEQSAHLHFIKINEFCPSKATLTTRKDRRTLRPHISNASAAKDRHPQLVKNSNMSTGRQTAHVKNEQKTRTDDRENSSAR